MSLGERCDEIVRLIDETFADLGITVGDDTPGASVTAFPSAGADDEPQHAPRLGVRPRRAASGF
jgi:hypothetical protein